MAQCEKKGRKADRKSDAHQSAYALCFHPQHEKNPSGGINFALSWSSAMVGDVTRFCLVMHTIRWARLSRGHAALTSHVSRSRLRVLFLALRPGVDRTYCRFFVAISSTSADVSKTCFSHSNSYMSNADSSVSQSEQAVFSSCLTMCLCVVVVGPRSRNHVQHCIR